MRRLDQRSEQGSVLVIAIVLMGVMLTVALASFSWVDTQTQRSREQRERETSLNLAEAVLYSQGFVLARTWPGNAAGGATMPTECTSDPPVQSLCPDPSTLAAANSSTPAAANFTNGDASANVSWTTTIRDNGGPLADAYDFGRRDEQQLDCGPGPCKWDANGDLKLWVQARAVVRGRPRNIVALLKREQFSEAFASNGVTAGSFEVTNSGNKTIINAIGSQVVVRCADVSSSTCADYEPAKNQVLPTPISVPSTPPAMSPAQLARFRAGAISANPSAYFTSCPATLTGRVVFIDLPTATSCTYTTNETYNSAAEPGIVIMPRGTLSLKGRFHGLLYMVNGQDWTAANPAVLTLAGGSEVLGGVAIDGFGRLVAGQASGNTATLTFVANAFSSLRSFGTTGLVQNTWRELPTG